jgi:PKD repeat protein
MRIDWMGRAHRLRNIALVAVIFGLQACNLNKVGTPPFFGPATLGLNISMSATPDRIVADNRSTSVVNVTVRDQNGHLAAGVPLVFAIFEAGSVVGLGQLSVATASTDGNGHAQTTYTAPARTDVNNLILIDIGARALQGDANGNNYRTVSIELFPAEPSQNPQVPGSKPPFCAFNIEPASGGSFHPGLQVLFQDASFDVNKGGTIIRYQWDFGDGTQGDETPDVNHAYSFPGQFSVTHVVTDNFGQSSSCFQLINVF